MGLRVLAVSAAVVLMPACSSAACDSVGRFALAVHVQDAAGAPVCDAVVTVTDGDYSLKLTTPGADCTYFAAGEREGTYTVEATRGALTGRVDGVSVKRTGECRVLNTEQVTVPLGP